MEVEKKSIKGKKGGGEKRVLGLGRHRKLLEIVLRTVLVKEKQAGDIWRKILFSHEGEMSTLGGNRTRRQERTWDAEASTVGPEGD